MVCGRSHEPVVFNGFQPERSIARFVEPFGPNGGPCSSFRNDRPWSERFENIAFVTRAQGDN